MVRLVILPPPLHLQQGSKPTFIFESTSDSGSSSTPSENTDQSAMNTVLPGFPTSFGGPIIVTPQDNLSMDAIHLGKFTYQDNITLERQAEVVMRITIPDSRGLMDLRSSSSSGILTSGYNFGTGSSREQAATALNQQASPSHNRALWRHLQAEGDQQRVDLHGVLGDDGEICAEGVEELGKGRMGRVVLLMGWR